MLFILLSFLIISYVFTNIFNYDYFSTLKPSLAPIKPPEMNNGSRLCIYDNIFYQHKWICKKAMEDSSKYNKHLRKNDDYSGFKEALDKKNIKFVLNL